MHITCTQDHLSRGLSIVTRAVGSRPTMPVLANVLLATDGSRLKLSATNLDLGITTWVTANVEEKGTVTVPARLLTDLVNSMPVGQIRGVARRREEPHADRDVSAKPRGGPRH